MSEIKESSVPYARRLQRAQMWANSLSALRSEVTGDLRDRVDQKYAFLFGDTVPAEPIRHGEEYGVRLHGAEGKLGFVALFHADAALHPVYRRRTRGMKYSYVEDIRSIIVAPQRISSRWRGLVLFHELHHAQFHKDGTFRGETDAHWIEEQAIYVDEHAAIRELYGTPYEDFIAKGSETVAAAASDGRIGRTELAHVANAAFDGVFDDAKTEGEQFVRRGPLMNDLAFSALALSGITSAKDRARFQRSLESDNGSLWLGAED